MARPFAPLPLLLLIGFAALAVTVVLKPGDLAAVNRLLHNYFAGRESTDPKAFAHFDRASTLQAQGNNEAAIAEYTEALAIDPNFAAVYENRANAYFNIGEYDLAIVDYGQMILLRPKFVDAYFRRAVAYYNKGDYERAIAGYDEALKLNPRFGQAVTDRNLAYLHRNNSTAPSPITFTQSASVQTMQTPGATVPAPAMERSPTNEPWLTTMRQSGWVRNTPWPSRTVAPPPRTRTTTAAPPPRAVVSQSGFIRRQH